MQTIPALVLPWGAALVPVSTSSLTVGQQKQLGRTFSRRIRIRLYVDLALAPSAQVLVTPISSYSPLRPKRENCFPRWAREGKVHVRRGKRQRSVLDTIVRYLGEAINISKVFTMLSTFYPSCIQLTTDGGGIYPIMNGKLTRCAIHFVFPLETRLKEHTGAGVYTVSDWLSDLQQVIFSFSQT